MRLSVVSAVKTLAKPLARVFGRLFIADTVDGVQQPLRTVNTSPDCQHFVTTPDCATIGKLNPLVAAIEFFLRGTTERSSRHLSLLGKKSHFSEIFLNSPRYNPRLGAFVNASQISGVMNYVWTWWP
jgi:hypothetical protein